MFILVNIGQYKKHGKVASLGLIKATGLAMCLLETRGFSSGASRWANFDPVDERNGGIKSLLECIETRRNITARVAYPGHREVMSDKTSPSTAELFIKRHDIDRCDMKDGGVVKTDLMSSLLRVVGAGCFH
jgi:hypothetical protein